MLRTMRQNTKVILWIVVGAFVLTIFAVWGLDLQTGTKGADPNIIGKVNGIVIRRSQYQAAYQQLAQQYRAASQNQALNYSQEEFLRSQAWDNVVYAILTDQIIRELGIQVSDDEIVGYIRNRPPAEVRQYFLDEQGNFDNNAYQAALNNPEIDWTNLEQLARERIPRIKLNEYIAAQVHVSEEEVQRAYEEESTELTLRYVTFGIDDVEVGDYTPSDAELEAYYAAHTDDFQEPDKARAEILRIPFAPGSRDRADAAYTAARVVEQLKSGEDFGVLAKTYSEAPTSFVEGNTGFIKPPQRADAYFAALEKLSPQGVTETPVETDEGYYVLRLLEKRTSPSGETEFNAQEILVKPAVSRQTSDSLYSVAEEIRTEAETKGLADAARSRGLEIITPDPFSSTGPIGGLGIVPALSRFAFSAEPGAMSKVLRDEFSIYVARLVERIPSHTTPLAGVRDVVRNRLIFEKKKSMARRNAQAFYQKARSSDFETAARTYDLELHKPDPFRPQDNLDDFGPNSALAEAALELETGAVSPPIEVRSRYVIFELKDRTSIDPEEYKKRIPELRQKLRQQKVQTYVAKWYERLKANSQIEDYRT